MQSSVPCSLIENYFPGQSFIDFYGCLQSFSGRYGNRTGEGSAGNFCVDIANVYFNVLEKHGIIKDSRTGYSIGLSYPPDWGERTMSLRSRDESVLKPEMRFHFMSGFWMDNWGMETIESILITDKDVECLVSVPRKLFIKN